LSAEKPEKADEFGSEPRRGKLVKEIFIPVT